MKVDIRNYAPDADQIDVVVGPNEDVRITISRDAHDEIFVSVTTKGSPKDLELILGGQADANA